MWSVSMDGDDDIAKVSRTLIGMDVEYHGREHIDQWLAEQQRSEYAVVAQ